MPIDAGGPPAADINTPGEDDNMRAVLGALVLVAVMTGCGGKNFEEHNLSDTEQKDAGGWKSGMDKAQKKYSK